MKDRRQNMENGHQSLPNLNSDDYPPMPAGVRPPKGGSGVPNRESKKNMRTFANAKMLEALARVYEVNGSMGVLRSSSLEVQVRHKIQEIIKEI